jgi:hypothetical protein
MTSDKSFLGLAAMFFILAVAFSILLWPDASLAAKIGFFALGFGSGIMTGQYLIRRKTSKPA